MQWPHIAFGQDRGQLRIAVIDPSRVYHSWIRTMLIHMHVARVVCYDDVALALRSVILQPPSLVIIDAELPAPVTCLRLVRSLRHSTLAPLCHTPILIIARNPTERLVEGALRCGAQLVLAKPFSAKALRQRIDWIARDTRGFVLDGEHYVIDGVGEQLDSKKRRTQTPAIAALLGAGDRWGDAAALQGLIDTIVFADKPSTGGRRRAGDAAMWAEPDPDEPEPAFAEAAPMFAPEIAEGAAPD